MRSFKQDEQALNPFYTIAGFGMIAVLFIILFMFASSFLNQEEPPEAIWQDDQSNDRIELLKVSKSVNWDDLVIESPGNTLKYAFNLDADANSCFLEEQSEYQCVNMDKMRTNDFISFCSDNQVRENVEIIIKHPASKKTVAEITLYSIDICR